METRKALSVPTSNRWDLLAVWSKVLDLPRQQVAVTIHAATLLAEEFEATRKAQEQILAQALNEWGAVAQRLKGRCGPLDVLAAGMDVARVGFATGAACWQEMADSARPGPAPRVT